MTYSYPIYGPPARWLFDPADLDVCLTALSWRPADAEKLRTARARAAALQSLPWTGGLERSVGRVVRPQSRDCRTR